MTLDPSLEAPVSPECRGFFFQRGFCRFLGRELTVHLQSKKPDKPHRHGLTKVAALSSAATLVLTLVVACAEVASATLRHR